MFSMLDYRAYRLYRLICWPFRVLSRILVCLTAVVSVVIVEQTSLAATVAPYGLLGKVAAAYVICEIIGMVLMGVVWKILGHMIDRAFFWVIDVVPCRGANANQAMLVAKLGPKFWAYKKLELDVANWTSTDTEDFVRSASWRTRLLFPIRERTNRVVRYLQRLQAEDQWDHLAGEEKAAIVKSLVKITPFERLVGNDNLFTSIVWVAVILVSISILH